MLRAVPHVLLACALTVVLALTSMPPTGWATAAPLDISGQGPVHVVPVKGTIDLGLAAFVRRAVREAEQVPAAALLVEIDTFGGRVDAATEIRDALLGTSVPVITYVNRRAWSAGALIALAGKQLMMAPGASIGAAEPRPAEEKVVSALRAEFEATAESRGKDPRLAAAMVDAAVDVPDAPTGKILTLSADRAVALQIADGMASDRVALLQALGVDATRVVEQSPNWGEQLSRWLTHPMAGYVLLTIVFIGLLAEVLTGGWGLPGGLALVALALFFGGRAAAGLVGLESLLLFALSLGLLVLEVAVLPGFGVAGSLGLLSLLWAIALTFSDARAAASTILTALGATAGLGFMLARFLRRRGAWRRLVLHLQQDESAGYVAPPSYDALLGAEGVAETALRPAGVARFGDQRVDVASDGTYVPAGAKVKVIDVSSSRVLVQRIISPE